MRPYNTFLLLCAVIWSSMFTSLASENGKASLSHIGLLVKQLDSDSFDTRTEASRKLLQFDPEEAIPVLLNILHKPALTFETQRRIEAVLNRLSPIFTWNDVVSRVAEAALQAEGLSSLTNIIDNLWDHFDRLDKTALRAFKERHQKLSSAKYELLHNIESRSERSDVAMWQRLRGYIEAEKNLLNEMGDVYMFSLLRQNGTKLDKSKIMPIDDETRYPGHSLSKELQEVFKAHSVKKSHDSILIPFVRVDKKYTLILFLDGRFCIRHGHSIIPAFYPAASAIDKHRGIRISVDVAKLFPKYARLETGQYFNDLKIVPLEFEVIQISPVEVTAIFFDSVRARFIGELTFGRDMNGIVFDFLKNLLNTNRIDTPRELFNIHPNVRGRIIAPTSRFSRKTL